jgi:osmotically inducible protein OsmC
MTTSSATATWEGGLRAGRGRFDGKSGVIQGSYSFPTRFEGAQGTNPEELIAAAHAGCFSMALALALGEGGNEPESIQTQAKVSLRNVDDLPTITKVALTTCARVPGLDDGAFQKAAEAAKQGCVVSRALGAIDEITLDATLEA